MPLKFLFEKKLKNNFFKNSFFTILSFIDNKLYKKIIFSFLSMTIAALLELLTLYIAYPFFSILSGESERAGEIENIFSLNNFFINENRIILSFILVIILLTYTRILNLKLLTKTAAEIGSELSKLVFRRVINRDFETLKISNISEITNQIYTHTNAVVYSLGLLFQLFSGFISASIIIFGLLRLAINETIFLFIAFGIFYISLGKKLKPNLNKNSQGIAKYSKQQMKILRESVASIRDIILGSYAEDIINEYGKSDKFVRRNTLNTMFLSGYPRFLLEGTGYLLIISTAIYFQSFVSIGTSLPIIALLALGLQRLLPCMQTIYNCWASIQGNRTSFKIIAKILKENPKETNRFSTKKIKKFKKNIQLKNISFSYSGISTKAIHNINLTIEKGSFIGIKGNSGTGKSTLMDLLMGLLRPSEGEYYIDDLKINNKNWDDYKTNIRKKVSHVPQEVFLLNETIIKNIIMNDTYEENNLIQKQKVIKAANIACIDKFIQTLPGKYNHLITDNGSNLSGGQKQRIGIARALYNQPEILFLDESTSALDNITELELITNLTKLKGTITIVFVSHRNKPLDFCEKIIHMKDNTIFEIN